MTNVTPLPLPLSPRQAEQKIRDISLDSANVRFSTHAQERMEERDISLHDVFRVLRKGSIIETPRNGKRCGEWVVKVERHARGNRDIGVVTAIVQDSHLIIITVEWEDL